MREYIRPARGKVPKSGVFSSTGRVLYRVWCWWGCAGRVLYRVWCWWGCAGRVLYRVWCWWGCAGRVFRGTAAGRTAVGEYFRGRAAARSHRERVYGRPQSLWPSLISWGTTFACNSPQGISSYETEPLKFCRFVPSCMRALRELHATFGGRVRFALIAGLVTVCDRKGRR